MPIPHDEPEIDRVIEGLTILRENGASGIIANRDLLTVKGARVGIGSRVHSILESKGFRSTLDGWCIDV